MRRTQTKAGARRAVGVVALGLFAVACAPPDRPTVDTVFERPLESAASLDPRVGEHRVAEGLAPISGGTLLVTRANAAIVSDPDRDRVLVVDLVTRRIMGTLAVPGGQPGRLAEDDAGRVHVVLRGSGEVLSFAPGHLDEARRTAVCQSPRGIAFDAEAGAMRVACRDGFLVTLGADGTVTDRVATGEDDLRDIVAPAGRLVLSRFRAAELVAVDPEGRPLERVRPTSSVEGFDRDGQPIEFLPQVAWRLAVNGEVLALVHQRATDREIELSQPDAYGGGGGGPSGGPGFAEDGFGGAARRTAPSCETGIVRSSVTIYDASLNVVATHAIPGATLPVDVALAPGGRRFAVIAAGEQGSLMPSVHERDVFGTTDPCFASFAGEPGVRSIPGPIAVAYDQRGRLLVQQRDPARLWIDGEPVELGGEERFDSGHAIFHGNAGLGLACASCHPEGGDDGHVWSFAGFGSLRTPALHGGILDTAPFHWNGDLPSIGALMNEVFERRMGGPSMDEREEASLARWIDGLPVSRGREGLDVAQVDRGAALFWGEAQCGSCHYGEQYTGNQTVDVGTGGAFQVPSLVGVSFRLPVMHDGCASTLAERFDPACGGGDQHGRTSQLGPSQVADLVAYLETL